MSCKKAIFRTGETIPARYQALRRDCNGLACWAPLASDGARGGLAARLSPRCVRDVSGVQVERRAA